MFLRDPNSRLKKVGLITPTRSTPRTLYKTACQKVRMKYSSETSFGFLSSIKEAKEKSTVYGCRFWQWQPPRILSHTGYWIKTEKYSFNRGEECIQRYNDEQRNGSHFRRYGIYLDTGRWLLEDVDFRWIHSVWCKVQDARSLFNRAPMFMTAQQKPKLEPENQTAMERRARFATRVFLTFPFVCTYHCVLWKGQTTPYTYVARASIRCTHMCYMFIVPEDNIYFSNITVSRI